MLDLSGCGDWQGVVDAWAASPAGQKLQAFVAQRHAAGAVIYPPEPLRAAPPPLAQTRIVILGRTRTTAPARPRGSRSRCPRACPSRPACATSSGDPARSGQAFPRPTGSLVRWAEGGTLLLNAVLTVEDGQPASHAGQGWELLTDALMHAAAEDPAPRSSCSGQLCAGQGTADRGRPAGPPGAQGQPPLALSALKPPWPFIGCGHFSTAKAWLEERGRGAPKRA